MKKIFGNLLMILLVLALVLGVMTACGGSNETETESGTESQTQSESVRDTESQTASETESESVSASESESESASATESESVSESESGSESESESGVNTFEMFGVKFVSVSDTGKVYKCNVLKVRSTPEMLEANVLGYLQKDRVVQRVGYNEDWTCILYDGDYAFVGTKYIDAAIPDVGSETESETDSESESASESESVTPPDVETPSESETPSETDTSEESETPGSSEQESELGFSVDGIVFRARDDRVTVKVADKLYTRPVNGTVVKSVKAGDVLDRIGYNEQWTCVRYNNTLCFIPTSAIDGTQPAESESESASASESESESESASVSESESESESVSESVSESESGTELETYEKGGFKFVVTGIAVVQVTLEEGTTSVPLYTEPSSGAVYPDDRAYNGVKYNRTAYSMDEDHTWSRVELAEGTMVLYIETKYLSETQIPGGSDPSTGPSNPNGASTIVHYLVTTTTELVKDPAIEDQSKWETVKAVYRNLFQVDLERSNGDWLYIENNYLDCGETTNVRGFYCRKSALTKVDISHPEFLTVNKTMTVIDGEPVLVHSDHVLNTVAKVNDTIVRLDPGTKVTVVGDSLYWARIRVTVGDETVYGYILKDFIV